jgi:NitT/TauT family transport system ATP-binding protein
MTTNIFYPEEEPVQKPVRKSELAQKSEINPVRYNSERYNSTDIINLVDIDQFYDDGKVKIFEKLNFPIKDITGKGQFIAIMGESGCGKTTILDFICGLKKPTAGKILLKGKEITENDNIPKVFQDYSSFFWMSVLKNVALPLIMKGVPKKKAEEEAMKIIEIVGLKGHEHKWPKIPLLSGGQLQRVAIARSLMANSNILVMDEPFGALDSITRRSMQEFLRKIFQEKNDLDPTMILVTHDTREAVFLATDIYVMSAKPSEIRLHIEVDLPDIRTPDLKDDPKFLKYVREIDTIMDTLKKESIEKNKNEIDTHIEKEGTINKFFRKIHIIK